VICAVAQPSLLADSNGFLLNFVNQELLAILGIIMTITLASAASLHLEFNKIEEKYQKVANNQDAAGRKARSVLSDWALYIYDGTGRCKTIRAWQSHIGGALQWRRTYGVAVECADPTGTDAVCIRD
jgi:hypothetical protein